MNSRMLIVNGIVVSSVLVVLLFTMLVVLQSENIVNENNNMSVSAPQAANIPQNLTKDNERQDIVKWAKAQKDYRESSSAPITTFHQYYGRTTEAWCQMFLNWCSEKAGVPSDLFYRQSFACRDIFNAYKNMNGVDRTTKQASDIKAGWLVYERFGGAGSVPNHVGIYTGNSWVHGNYNDYYVREIPKNYGNLVGYAKPYYRSKVYFNTNKKGASMNGYVYPKEYSTWYVEEKETSLSTKGLLCPGYSFEGWYTENACINKKVKVSSNEYGALRVYAKWKIAFTDSQDNANKDNIKEDVIDTQTPETTLMPVVPPRATVRPTVPPRSTKKATTNSSLVAADSAKYKKDKVKKIVSESISEVNKEIIEEIE